MYNVVLQCENCIETNRVQRGTYQDFFEDKVIACSKRSEGFHGNYQGTTVRLLSSLLLRAKLIVLLIKSSFSGSFEKWLNFIRLRATASARNPHDHIHRIFKLHTFRDLLTITYKTEPYLVCLFSLFSLARSRIILLSYLLFRFKCIAVSIFIANVSVVF